MKNNRTNKNENLNQQVVLAFKSLVDLWIDKYESADWKWWESGTAVRERLIELGCSEKDIDQVFEYLPIRCLKSFLEHFSMTVVHVRLNDPDEVLIDPKGEISLADALTLLKETSKELSAGSLSFPRRVREWGLKPYPPPYHQSY